MSTAAADRYTRLSKGFNPVRRETLGTTSPTLGNPCALEVRRKCARVAEPAATRPGPFDYDAGIGRFQGVGKFEALIWPLQVAKKRGYQGGADPVLQPGIVAAPAIAVASLLRR
jgi:hypothetical protein